MRSANKKTKKLIKEVKIRELSTTLDRTKLSSRNAAYVMSTVISRLEGDISKIGCSRETIWKRRIKDKTDLLSTIKKNYHPESMLMVH